MQIDFHHAVTYVLARIAGFPRDEAHVVAYASQYVDDAVEGGTISFLNGAMYERISSAHKMLDYRNFEALADHLVWVPFHFLPGNGGAPAGQDPPGPFVRKLVCRPDSPPARDLVRMVIEQRGRKHALHRLGITMHTYADTWAHQGFCGFAHEVNHATDIRSADGEPDQKLADKLRNYFVNAALPLGHGTVLSNPDKPYHVWSYVNGLGERVQRDNPRDFLDACDHMTRAMQRFRAGDPDFAAPGIPAADRVLIEQFLVGIRNADEKDRHAVWLAQIALGIFSFGAEKVTYAGEGPGSWKAEALAEAKQGADGMPYRPEFLRSNWKLFHDALQAHRFDVIHNILPEYGICVA
jgi:hypothetical protein